MTDFRGDPRPRSALKPWLIGCGILLIVSVASLFGAGWWWFQKAVTSDPARVVTLAADILPGAKSPPRVVAKWGVDSFGYKMAVFGSEDPKGAADETTRGEDAARGMVFVLASGPIGSKVSLREEMAKGATEEDEGHERLGQEKKLVGGVEIEFEKSRSTQRGTKALCFTAELPIGRGRVTMLMVLGPETRFDHEAMNEFLAGVAKLEPREPQPSKPQPDKPQASKTGPSKTGPSKTGPSKTEPPPGTSKK